MRSRIRQRACRTPWRPETTDPYASLDPEAARSARPLFQEASTSRVLLRGLRKRCPRCGEGRIWVSWFQAKARCPACDLRFEQEEGGFLGAMTINYVVACAIWVVAIAIAMVLTVPFIPVMPLIVMSIGILTAVPTWFYPRSKMLWAAVEFLTARSEPGYHTPTVRDPRSDALD